AYLTICGAILWLLARMDPSGMSAVAFFMFAYFGVFLVPIPLLAGNSLSGRASPPLAECDDTSVVGPLLESLYWTDEEARRVAKVALLRLLPRMTADDARQLTPGQREVLHATLRNDAGVSVASPIAFTLASLQALEQVGDEKAVS